MAGSTAITVERINGSGLFSLPVLPGNWSL